MNFHRWVKGHVNVQKFDTPLHDEKVRVLDSGERHEFETQYWYTTSWKSIGKWIIALIGCKGIEGCCCF